METVYSSETSVDFHLAAQGYIVQNIPHFDIILPFKDSSVKWPFYSRFPNENSLIKD
jgi:hypothetical protein